MIRQNGKVVLRNKRNNTMRLNSFLNEHLDDVDLFFACDDNYIPMFSVVIESIKKHLNPRRKYNINVLYTGNISAENQERIEKAYSSDNIVVDFVDITDKVSSICEKLHTRDYYSKSTYYRLFIPELYPNLNKALYLDSDILLLDDVAKLFDNDLKDNLVGAIPDESVWAVPEFQRYVETRINLDSYKKYFNAGILLMNLKEMRKIKFEELFLDLLSNITFNVAQDQDYLNTICKDRVLYLDKVWNKMPIVDDVDINDIKLIHYNLSYKPWQIDGVNYADKFWEFSDKSIYAEEVKNIKRNYTKERQQLSDAQTVNLIKMALEQAEDELTNNEIRNLVDNIKFKYFA